MNFVDRHFEASNIKALRTSVNSFYDDVKLCIETIKQFAI